MQYNKDFNFFLTYANLIHAYTKFLSIMNFLMHKINKEDHLFDINKINNHYSSSFSKLLSEPESWQNYIQEYCNNLLKLNDYFTKKFYGQNIQPIFSESEKDKRFRNLQWQENLYFDFIKQHYLMLVQMTEQILSNKKDVLDNNQYKRVYFIIKQFLDAISPSNFPFTNPEVLNNILDTNGQNLLQGLENFLNDCNKSFHTLNISTSSEEDLILGNDIATTQGKIIYQNKLMQLIHYKPESQQVYETPMLIIPPWINKYYILDLKEKNSMVKWLVDQGYDVYLISWVNPDKSYANVDFEDYMIEGPVAAIDFITHNYNKKKINITGYCIGGVLSCCAISYLKKQNDNRINALTLLTTLLDYSQAGEIKLFLDEENIQQIEKHVDALGIFPADELSAIFSMLRANDLIWGFVINNYLLGRKPSAFDFLYWNSDSTSLPAKMQKFYLRNMYIENNLVKKDKLYLKNKAINLHDIDLPVYALATQEDHIAPWQAVFGGLKHLEGKVQFALAGSGHIAGVVSPPSKEKYGYYTNKESDYKNDDAQKWLENAKMHNGSWWLNWQKWLKKHSGQKVDFCFDSLDNFAIEDAPGSYVKVKYQDILAEEEK